MLYYFYIKIKQRQLKKKILRGRKHIQIESKFECTKPDNIFIEDYTYIGPNCRFYGYGRIITGTNVIIGNDVMLLTSNHNYRGELIPYDAQGVHKDIIIQENVWVGSYAKIMPGVKINEGAIIACGSVVTKEVPYCAIVGGNPAQIIGYRDVEKYEFLKRNHKLYLYEKYGK